MVKDSELDNPDRSQSFSCLNYSIEAGRCQIGKQKPGQKRRIRGHADKAAYMAC